MFYYFNYFFIFSIFGHFIESVIYFINDWDRSSGFLYGYWTPVYGFGVVFILLISKYIFKKLKTNKYIELLLFFILTSLTLTIIEYIGGHFLHFLLHKDLWDYSKSKFNFGKYISLEMSLTWGICSIIIIYLVKPWMDKIVVKIPKIITYILIILYLFDNIITVIIKSKI